VSRHPALFQWPSAPLFRNAKTISLRTVAKWNARGYIQCDPPRYALIESCSQTRRFRSYSLFATGSYRSPSFDGRCWPSLVPQIDRINSDSASIRSRAPTGWNRLCKNSKHGMFFRALNCPYHPLPPRCLAYVEASTKGFRAGSDYPGGFTLSAPPYSGRLGWTMSRHQGLFFLANRIALDYSLYSISKWRNFSLIGATSFFLTSRMRVRRSNDLETNLDAQVMRLWTSRRFTYNNARLVGSQPASSIQICTASSGR